MNIKTNVVKPVGVLAEREFIAICITRQNMKRHYKSEFTKTVLQSIALLIFVGFGILIIAGVLSHQANKQTKEQLETQALIQQLEKGEVVEMTARVGAKP